MFVHPFKFEPTKRSKIRMHGSEVSSGLHDDYNAEKQSACHAEPILLRAVLHTILT